MADDVQDESEETRDAHAAEAAADEEAAQEQPEAEGEAQAPADQQPGEEAKATAEEGEPKKKKGGCLKTLGCLVIILVGLLVLLIALLPTIISSKPVEGAIEGAAKDALKRDVAIGDLSFGWTSGLRLTALTVKEPSGDVLLGFKEFFVDISFSSLLGGNIVVKELRLTDPQIALKRDKDGKLSIDDILAPQPGAKPAPPQKPTPAPAASGPTKLPNIELHAKIENLVFTFTDEQTGQTLEVKKFNTTVDIPNINSPIALETAFDLLTQGRTEHVTLSANAQVAENNVLATDKAKASLKFQSVPLQANVNVDMAKFTGAKDAKGIEALITCDLKELMDRVAVLAGVPEGMKVSGQYRTEIAGTGQLDKTIGITGKTTLTDLAVTLPPAKGDKAAKPTSIGPLAITVYHDLEADAKGDSAKIDRLDVASDFLNVKSSGEASDLKGALKFAYAANVDADMDAIVKTFGAFIPPEAKLSGKTLVDIKADGTLSPPKAAAKGADANPFEMLNHVNMDGKLQVGRVKYTTAGTAITVADMRTEQLSLKDGLFKLLMKLKVNEGPTAVDLATNFTKKDPTFVAKIDANNVVLREKVELLGYIIPILILPEDGKIDTTASLNVDAQGESFDWATLQKNLKATGGLKLSKGSVSGGEIVSKLLKLTGGSGALRFKGMDAGFKLAEGKIHSDGIKVMGQGLDFALAGWTSIVPDDKGEMPMEYKAGSEILKKYLGKDYQRVVSTLGKEGEGYSPLLIAGTAQHPKVKLNLPSVKDAVKGAIKGAAADALKGVLGGKKKGGKPAEKPKDKLKGALKGFLR